MHKLKVNEIGFTISGEVGQIIQGSPILLIRLQGCNLSCPWCDAKESQDLLDKGTYFDIRLIGKEIMWSAFPILITGGEPLIQTNILIHLFRWLKDKGSTRTIQIETNGTIWINPELREINPNVSYVVDYKLDNESEVLLQNWSYLNEKDFIKILVTKEEDIPAFVEVMEKINREQVKCKFAVSCVNPQLYSKIVDLVIDKNLPVSVNVQIHKLIGTL